MPDRSNPALDALVEGWISHFWSADHTLKWTYSESELAIWLDSQTLLAGRIDARGITKHNNADAKFFSDWKTKNPRYKKQWKATWRKSIQALTYGVLLREVDPTSRLFLVRMAFKDNTYDHEWFEYEDKELNVWMKQLRDIAAEIRAWRQTRPEGPWPLNFDYCFRYGVNYQCPYFQNGCDPCQFDAKIGFVERVPHLKIEVDMKSRMLSDPNFVLLDATRAEEWRGCHEKYRKEWEENLREAEASEALQFGLDFHRYMAIYYQKLIAGKI